MSQLSTGTPSPVLRVRLIFFLVIIAYFMDIIDASIVTVALPSIRVEFGASIADSQWIYGAYAITLAGFLLLMGRAGDIYGQKKIFVSGLVIFTIASFTGGIAPSLISLIISRSVQGIGAAMTTVTAFAIFIRIFPEGPDRNKALGYIVAVLAGGFAAGAVIGGVLTTFVGWRWVMFINVPIGIVAAILCQRTFPTGGGYVQNRHLDIPGALSVTSGIILLIFGLTNAADPGQGFTSALTYIPLIASVLVLGLFLRIESRSASPLMPLSFIRRGSVLTANVLALVLTSVVGGVGFIIPVYFQNILGYSALDSGLLTLPPALIFLIVGGFVASRLVNKFGAKKMLLVSSGLVAIGTLLLTPMSPNGNPWVLMPGFLIWALGASIGFPAINIAAVAGTKPGEEGLASGVVNTSSRIGFPVGLAILLTVAGVFDPPSSPAGIVAGFRVAVVAASLIGVLGFLIALKLKDVKPPWASGGWKPNEMAAQ